MKGVIVNKQSLYRYFVGLIAGLLFAGACHAPVRDIPANDEDFKNLLEKSKKYALEYPYHTDSALMILHELLPGQQDANRAWVMNTMGVAYDIQGKYDSAAYYLYAASRLAEEVKDDSLQMSVYSNLGILQFAMNNADEAVKYYRQSLAIAENRNDSMTIAKLLNNIGNTYLTITGEYEKSIPFFEQCVDICIKIGYRQGMQTASQNLAQIFNAQSEPDKALQAINRLTEQGMTDRYTEFILGEIHVLKGNYSEAIRLLKQIFRAPLNTREFEFTILKSIAEAYKASGNLDSTVVYLEKSYALRDSLHNQQTAKTINELKIDYETEKKEHAIEQQQNIISRQNLQHRILIVGVALCLFFLFLLWYMLRLRIHRNRTLAEMNATKDKFFSIISHDIKNPAVTQRDALQLLVKNASQWDADTLAKYYDGLLKSAE